MNQNEIILTPEGRQKLVDELAWREGEFNAEIIERIKAARDFGDLSENSEYDDAKEEQAKNEARIYEIRTILASARISETPSASTVEVSIGSTVDVKDASGKETTFKIVGTTETNSLEHKISNESPMGAALIGHKAGETVEYTTPSGRVCSYQILKITR